MHCMNLNIKASSVQEKRIKLTKRIKINGSRSAKHLVAFCYKKASKETLLLNLAGKCHFHFTNLSCFRIKPYLVWLAIPKQMVGKIYCLQKVLLMLTFFKKECPREVYDSFFFKRQSNFSRLFYELKLVGEVDDQIQTVTWYCICASYTFQESLGCSS